MTRKTTRQRLYEIAMAEPPNGDWWAWHDAAQTFLDLFDPNLAMVFIVNTWKDPKWRDDEGWMDVSERVDAFKKAIGVLANPLSFFVEPMPVATSGFVFRSLDGYAGPVIKTGKVFTRVDDRGRWHP